MRPMRKRRPAAGALGLDLACARHQEREIEKVLRATCCVRSNADDSKSSSLEKEARRKVFLLIDDHHHLHTHQAYEVAHAGLSSHLDTLSTFI